jgi:hypothetical protein
LLEGGVEVGVVELGLGSGGRLVHEARVGAAISGGRRNIAGMLLYGSPLLVVPPYPSRHSRPRMSPATHRAVTQGRRTPRP